MGQHAGRPRKPASGRGPLQPPAPDLSQSRPTIQAIRRLFILPFPPAQPTRAELQALRDKCEELADDVRALSTVVHALWCEEHVHVDKTSPLPDRWRSDA